MKTINFLTSHFLPENTACTNRVLSYIKALEKKYKVNVICLTEKNKTADHQLVKYNENITIHYQQQNDFDGRNFFKRAFYEIYYVNKLINISKKLPADITITTAPYMFMIPFVALRVKGTKILDIRDMVWEYLDENNKVKSVIKHTLTSIMRNAIKKFNKVFVTNEYEYKLAKNTYLIDNVHIIPNGIEQSRFNELKKITPVKNEKFTITYVGNLGLAQNIQVLLETAKKLKDINFVIIGDGIEATKLKSYAKNNNLNNVTFTGKLSWNGLHEYYQKTSVLYAQLDAKYVSAMPSKLYEYASIGLPIIYGGIGQAQLFVQQLDNAQCISPNSSDELSSAILNIKDKNINISTKNRQLVQTQYLRETVVQDAMIYINNLQKTKTYATQRN